MKEIDIRPKAIFEEYLKLSAQDAEVMLLDGSEKFVDILCPACESGDREDYCQKNGFMIKRCADCGSIFCSPRPAMSQLQKFYLNSSSSKFWAEQFLPTVVEARREKLFKPKAKQIYDLLSLRGLQPQNICDVGAGHGLLLEELQRFWHTAAFYAIEPGRESAAICRHKGFKVLEKMVEEAHEWRESADLVTCFEVIEHVFNPRNFIASIYRLIKKGGFCLITGLGGDGFDIQVLGDESRSIFPPHHLNFMSVRGLEQIFTNVGFTNVEITTPGKLDVDIVKNAIQEQGVAVPLVIRTILDRGESACEQLQKYLVEHKLSSHVWILARK